MLEVLGIALVPIIVALVGAAKAAGLPHKYAPLLNAILSVIGYFVVQAVDFRPDWGPYVKFVLEAAMVFLSAAGFFREGVQKRRNNS